MPMEYEKRIFVTLDNSCNILLPDRYKDVTDNSGMDSFSTSEVMLVY